MSLVTFTRNGIYCPRADCYIDPVRSVPRALITHGHSDHARRGMGQYICAEASVPILRTRLGKINALGQPYAKQFTVNGVKVSFHPAGHVLGSAQVRLEHRGEIWVITGDYKVEDDQISGTFAPVKCHHFVTETTFGLPVYQWEDQFRVYAEINQWWQHNKANGRPSIIQAYSLGKAQRIIRHLDREIGNVVVHPTIARMNEAYRAAGSDPGPSKDLEELSDEEARGAVIVVPGINPDQEWFRRLHHPALAAASGWYAIRNTRRQGAVDKRFVLSDHADWKGLNDAIDATGADNIYVTHGYENEMRRWLSEKGKNAQIVRSHE